nr:hypothetical protein [Tanacetum cinerariifolium]
MSTPVFVDLEISTFVDGAQSPQVPVPFPENLYEAIRHACLVEMDTESEPFEDPVETETPESPHTVASPTSLPDSTQPSRHAEESEDSDTIAEVVATSDSAFRKRFRSLSESSPSSSPPNLLLRKHSRGTSELVEYDEEEDEEDADEDEEVEESLNSDSKREDVEDEDEAVPEGQQWAALVVETAVGESQGFGYGALRCWGIATREGQMPSVFEVGQGSRSVPEPKRPERVSALRQPTLTTWIDRKDSKAYIDVPSYPPLAPLVQTLPFPKWSSSSLPISLIPYIIPSPISSPMIPLTVPLLVASSATAEVEIAEERRTRLDLAEIVDSIWRGQEPKGEV